MTFNKMAFNLSEYIRNSISAKSDDQETGTQRILIATCVLMLEMANADNEFTQTEEERIVRILKEEFNLSKEAAQAIISLSESERKRSLDLWQFTNLINNHFSNEEKMHIMETLWRVIYADGHVDMHEEYLMRKLSNLLNMKHKDMIQAKFNARQSYPKTENNK
jgi:uncharacterized tellurite resistance protein B-like protein